MLRGEAARDFREGLGALLLCSIGDYISGLFLDLFRGVISSAPIILALLPAASDARGDVYSSYGSRLGTLLHIGTAKRYMREELTAILVLIIGVNLWIGSLVSLIYWMTSRQFLGVVDVAFLALLSAFLGALFMLPATTVLAVYSFRRGLDPDNVVSPIATLFGDMVTIPSLVAAYYASVHLPGSVELGFTAASAAVAVLASLYAWRRMRRFRRIIRENFTVILASTFISSLAGAVILSNLSTVLSLPGILVVIPAFLEDGGALATRFSSKLATRLHLGLLEARIKTSEWILEQLIVNIALSLVAFSLLGVFGAAMSMRAGANAAWALRVFLTVLVSGFLLSLLATAAAYVAGVAAFRAGLDPDNVLAPLLTSFADILGISLLTLFTYVFLA